MPLQMPKKLLAHFEFLRSFETIENELKSINNKREKKRINSYLVENNNPLENSLHIEDSLNFLQKEQNGNFEEVCKFLAKRFYTKSSNYNIYINGNYYDELKLFQSGIDNFLLKGFFLIENINHCTEANQHNFFSENIKKETFSSDDILKLNSFTDLHLHLGATIRFEYKINEFIKNPHNVKGNNFPKDLYITLLQNKIDIKNIPLYLSIIETFLIEHFMHNSNEIRDLTSSLEKGNIIKLRSLFANNISIRNKRFIRFIVDDFFLKNAIYEFQSENIVSGDRYLTLFFINQLFSQISECEKSLIRIYFLLRNVVKSILTQQHRRVGLNYFGTYSGSSFKKTHYANEAKESMKSLFYLDKEINMEVRITPDKKAQNIADKVYATVKEFEKIKELKTYNLKFIFHFIKEKDKRESGKSLKHIKFNLIRYHSLYSKLKNESFSLMEFLLNDRYKSYPHKSIIQTHKRQNLKEFDLSSYFAGIDSASKEHFTPPYVFAPTFRYFKTTPKLSSFYNKKSFKEKKAIKPKFTFHVGEDFRDLLTGLRNIFEVILFFDFRDGDRLGHALALGIDTKKYYERVKSIVISKEELFDNVVFIYHILNTFNKFEKFSDEKQKLDLLFRKLSKQIYGEKNYDIQDFIEAWLLRRNSPLALNELSQRHRVDFFKNRDKMIKKEYLHSEKQDYFTSALPDFFNSHINKFDIFESRYEIVKFNNKAYEIYEAYIRNQEVFKKGQELYDGEVETFLELSSYIQEVLLDLVRKRDISIETMPTSNIFISYIENLKEHPILKFNPLNGENINTFLCSDDPMIHDIDIFREYDYMFNYLKENGNKKEALKYLQNFADNAKKEFFRGE